MDPSRGDLDCDSSRAGLMRLQVQRGRGGEGGARLSSAQTIRGGIAEEGCAGRLAIGLFFFLFVSTQLRIGPREGDGAGPRHHLVSPSGNRLVCRCDWEPMNEI